MYITEKEYLMMLLAKEEGRKQVEAARYAANAYTYEGMIVPAPSGICNGRWLAMIQQVLKGNV